jgi:hypothetical protein
MRVTVQFRQVGGLRRADHSLGGDDRPAPAASVLARPIPITNAGQLLGSSIAMNASLAALSWQSPGRARRAR